MEKGPVRSDPMLIFLSGNRPLQDVTTSNLAVSGIPKSRGNKHVTNSCDNKL